MVCRHLHIKRIEVVLEVHFSSPWEEQPALVRAEGGRYKLP